jgi:hypothetical protein
MAALNAWFQAQEEEERITAHYETASLDTRARLEERVTRADDIRAAFRTFQLEVSVWLWVQRERRERRKLESCRKSAASESCAVTPALNRQTPNA